MHQTVILPPEYQGHDWGWQMYKSNAALKGDMTDVVSKNRRRHKPGCYQTGNAGESELQFAYRQSLHRRDTT